MLTSQRRLGANISMLFIEVPLLERFARAKAAGFGAVEMQFEYGESAETLAAAARAADVEIALINVPVIPDGGGPMTSSAPGQEEAFRAGVATAKRYAAALGAGAVNVLPGNVVEGAARAEQIALYRGNLAHAAQQMAEIGVRVVAEPINTVDRPTMLISTVDQMAEVLGGVDAEVFIQFDVYHVAMMGEDPAATFRRHAARVGHVQLADAPGRHEPGSGAIDFPAVLAAIDASGYSGWINGEYEPAGRTEDGLGWLGALARA